MGRADARVGAGARVGGCDAAIGVAYEEYARH